MKRDISVVVVPFLAFGHMMPLYQLTIALAKFGIHVHYVSTPRNISRLPSTPHNLEEFLNFVRIPMPMLDDYPLPDGAEATLDLTTAGMEPKLLKHLAVAFDMIQQPVKELVASLSPDWIIIDLLAYWGIQIGREFGVPVLGFSPFSAATMLFFGLTEHLVRKDGKKVRSTVEKLTASSPWVDFPSSVAYRHFEALQTLMTVYTGENSLADKISRTLDGCEAVLVRSCNEFEGEYLRAFANGLGKHVISTGLLVPELTKKTILSDVKWKDTFDWLSHQKEKSTIFVGFGSECRLKQEEVHEIARGLELSKLPFLWALRKPIWVNDDDSNMFPPNFIQNTSEQGRVCFGWAPQLEVLGHPSIGASLFHSGWGSTIETIQFGHRLIVLPLLYDQFLTARLLVEKDLAVEVKRGDDGSFTGEGISNAIREAVFQDGAKRLREVAAFVRDYQLQQRYVDNFVKFLNKGVPNKKSIIFLRF